MGVGGLGGWGFRVLGVLGFGFWVSGFLGFGLVSGISKVSAVSRVQGVLGEGHSLVWGLGSRGTSLRGDHRFHERSPPSPVTRNPKPTLRRLGPSI